MYPTQFFSSLDNEIKVWLKIDALADEALSKYDTTYQEDMDLLDKAYSKHVLTYNERNCVLFRSGEKKILHSLKEKAKVFARLTKMSQDDAKNEVAHLKDFDHCLNYFETCILPKLPIYSQAHLGSHSR